jgi:4-amino-4-deoxy-L-arabinose transferase-like glycosyltransferase
LTSHGESPWLERLLRPGASDRHAVVVDLCWLVGLGVIVIGVGLDFRDPWPADEPRFALIARDMLRTGDWLVPRVGGDLYPDKPPFYFWLMTLAIGATGSVRAGFLVPSLCAGVGTVLLVYDLVRRIHGREAAFAGALLLLCTFQFVWQARQAQIDATLCLLTTLGLYGLSRYLLADGTLRWWLAGWGAAGLGIITKGVGFLPLLALLPWAWLARRAWPVRRSPPPLVWVAGVGALLAAIAIWFVPMWLATSASDALLAYRNEILFHQTVTRYAEAWHHHEPAWYYVVQVIPPLWLPAIALLPWAWPRWRSRLRDRDALTAIALSWAALVLVFFTASSGKRGVYILPALPAFTMALAPCLPELLRARGPRRVAFALTALVAASTAAGAAYFTLEPDAAQKIARQYGATPVLPLTLAACGSAAALLFFRVRDAWPAWFVTLAAVLVVTGVVVNPRIDGVRSTRDFIADVEKRTTAIAELGWVGAKEQYLLQMRRPSFNFGHARWRERDRELDDAATWLSGDSARALLIDRRNLSPCFAQTRQAAIGRANGIDWVLASGRPDPACVARGNAAAVIAYDPR